MLPEIVKSRNRPYFLDHFESKIIDFYRERIRARAISSNKKSEGYNLERIESKMAEEESKPPPPSGAYSIIVNGREISQTILPRFIGVRKQRRLESLALADLKIYKEKYGESIRVRFLGYEPKSSKLRAKLYKPVKPLPLVK